MELQKAYCEARRNLIRAKFDTLNPRQIEAVMATEGPLLILAGAGSGKTTVLINRIANLLRFGRASDSTELPAGVDEESLRLLQAGGPEAEDLAALEPVAPWRILAITFTNKAADELKARLERMLGESANDIWACTFHSACVRILRRDGDNFTIYDTSDSQSLIKRILKDLEMDEKSFPPRSVLSEISRSKDAMVGPAEYQVQAKASHDFRRQKIGLAYAEYARRLFAANALDFDDLIACTVKLLQENGDVRSYWQRRFQYVLVDEYQDTNHLQYLLASTLAGHWGNICVVGDDDQSIYKFRGATIENILSFEKQFKGCRTIRLEQNYRSTGHILNAANAVIRNNLGRKGKELWTDAGPGELIQLTCADNENEEAQIVASSIMASFSSGANWRDHAILYRMNAQSSQLEFAFKRSGIPYRIVGGTRFFDRAEVKDVLSYLNVIASPADDLRLQRIVNSPPRGIGERSMEVAGELARHEGCSLYEILGRADRYPELKRAALKMKQFVFLMEELRAFSQVNPPDALYDELLEKTGYLRMLESSEEDKDQTRAENVKEMTMHSAKGLEFPTVYIVGMEESIFPGLRAIGEPEEMEEERRLCYVAITRAKRKLHLLCARQRMIFGRTSANRCSRFVDEIPEEDIRKQLPKGYGYSEKRQEPSYGWRERQGEPSFAYRPPEARQRSVVPGPRKPAAPPASTNFALGDRVRHKAFGDGTIAKLTPMGNDFLVEIRFDKIGSKKLMLRAAALHMDKIE